MLQAWMGLKYPHQLNNLVKNEDKNDVLGTDTSTLEVNKQVFV